MDEQPVAKKSLGQHWLNDPASLQAMIAVASVTSKDTVLEVGPGPGALTELLLQQAQRVVAVELDERLARQLSQKHAGRHLDVITQDILEFDFTSLPADYKLVANIPYYLTSNLIRTLSETPNRPKVAALLVQKEVAERVAAEPGHMSLLSVTAQVDWQVQLGRVVPARLFLPPPKVDSQILVLNRRAEPLLQGMEPKEFFRLVKAGFSQRRKTLLNSLSGGLGCSRDETRAVCERASINCERRAQTLSLNEWRQLYSALHS